MKNKLYRMSLFILVLAFLLFPAATFARTVKMTAYKQCIKEGNYVYCNTINAIYKINLKTKSKKTIYKMDYYSEEDEDISLMKKKGNYLYVLFEGPTGGFLKRLDARKVNKSEKLFSSSYHTGIEKYVVSGNKVYYDSDEGKYVLRTNGKSLKRTKVKCRMTTKKTNKKGYKVIAKGKKTYLKTPNKTIYLGRKHTFALY